VQAELVDCDAQVLRHRERLAPEGQLSQRGAPESSDTQRCQAATQARELDSTSPPRRGRARPDRQQQRAYQGQRESDKGQKPGQIYHTVWWAAFRQARWPRQGDLGSDRAGL